MSLVASGDQAAFSCLVRRHKDAAFRLIYRFFGKEAEAEDLVQEVFLRVWRSSGQYEPTAKFTTWLYAIAANVCKSEARSLWRRNIKLIGSFWRSGEKSGPDGLGALEPHADGPTPEEAALRAEQSRLILAAIRSLPVKQRLALTLWRYEELSYREIALVLGCSVSAVEALLVRAKASLQKKLGPVRK